MHFHILPRKSQGDRFANNDDIFPALEKSGIDMADDLRSTLPHQTLKVEADESRVARSVEEMESEAQWLKTFFET